MRGAAPKTIAAHRFLDGVLRKGRGRILAGLVARLKDLQLAGDALQDASIAALKHWGRTGPPNDPVAWLMRVGLNKGLDRIRANRRAADKAEILVRTDEPAMDQSVIEAIPDERLWLIFTCCLPALDEKSRIALTLRTVGHLTTREIADAFLDTEKAMGQRLFRAKGKIRKKGIAFAVPDCDLWPERLGTVLSTLSLIFTAGYVNGDRSVRDLCRVGIFLARLLMQLQPDEAETEGAYALMVLTHARRNARTRANGAMVPLEKQNRALWKADEIEEARHSCLCGFT